MSDFETPALVEVDARLAKLSRLTVRQAASAITERHKAELDALQKAAERQMEASRKALDQALAEGKAAALAQALDAVVDLGFAMARKRLERRSTTPAMTVDGPQGSATRLSVTTVHTAGLNRETEALLERAARAAPPGDLPVVVAGDLPAFDQLRGTDTPARRRVVLMVDLSAFLTAPAPRSR